MLLQNVQNVMDTWGSMGPGRSANVARRAAPKGLHCSLSQDWHSGAAIVQPSKLYHGSGFVDTPFILFILCSFHPILVLFQICWKPEGLLSIAYCLLLCHKHFARKQWLRLWRIWRLRWLTQCGRRCRRSEIWILLFYRDVHGFLSFGHIMTWQTDIMIS